MRNADSDKTVTVDRVACTAHGVCAVISGGAIALDEFGYPIESQVVMDRRNAQELARACPARALLLQ